MSKFRHSGVMVFGDTECTWVVRHWGGFSTEHRKPRGLSVSVCVEPGHTKELIVEFAFTDYFFSKPPQQSQFEDRLRSSVEAAMRAGWRPHARGKAFVYSVPVVAQPPAKPKVTSKTPGGQS